MLLLKLKLLENKNSIRFTVRFGNGVFDNLIGDKAGYVLGAALPFLRIGKIAVAAKGGANPAPLHGILLYENYKIKIFLPLANLIIAKKFMIQLSETSLLNCYEETLTLIDAKKMSKYNLLTVKNFIIHLNSLAIVDREEVEKGLYEYLILIKDINCPKSNVETIQLFNQYLQKYAKYYSKIGFITYISYETYIYIIILFVPFFLLLKASFIWYIFFTMGLIVYYFRVLVKKKQHKLFSPGY